MTIDKIKEIAKNLVYFTDHPLAAYPEMNGGGFFTIGFDGEEKAEVFVYGVKEQDLNKIVNLFNTYTYYGNNMFSETKHKVSIEKLLPYITLCNEKIYKSQITGKIVHFN